MIAHPGGLPKIHLFDGSALNADQLAAELIAAGLDRSTGFEPLTRSDVVRGGKRVKIPSGSLVLIHESTFSEAQRALQDGAADLASLYLVFIARDSDDFTERARRIPSGLPPFYQHVVVVPESATEEAVAGAAAALVEQHRTDPDGVLLWILDDAADRFAEGGCWAQLIQSAETVVTRQRLRVVRSLVDAEALAGSRNRGVLVSRWRDSLIEPALGRGTRVVMVTDNQFSPEDPHLGEMWADTVLQRLPQAAAFVASIWDIDPGRSGRSVGIWINEDGSLPQSYTDLVLSALSEEPDADLQDPMPSAVLLSGAPVRAVALSSPVFRPVWSELLRYRDDAIRKSLHFALMRAGPLDDEQRRALWQALRWNNDLAARLAADSDALSDWVSGLAAEYQQDAMLAWMTVLEHPMQREDALAREFRSRVENRFCFLAICDEWTSLRGGVSTLNRELCLALARAGHRVRCLVARATREEIAKAADLDVELLLREPWGSEHPSAALSMPLQDGVLPDFIIGHGSITGPAAQRQAGHLTGAQRIHFLHTSPEEIEMARSRDPGRSEDSAGRAETKRRQEAELARGAALAVGVGPRLFEEWDTLLTRPNRPMLHRLDPGFMVPLGGEDREPPSKVFCLVLGRVNDYYVKGLDIAAGALGVLAREGQARYGREITLLVRGTEPGTAGGIIEALSRDAGSGLRFLRIRNLSPDPEDVTEDLLQATLMLVPSRAEGFGLVGLEAIAAGTPVLISDRSGLAQLLEEHGLAGDTVVRVGDDGGDVERWKAAIDSVLMDTDGAFARAERLRHDLGRVCTWEDSVSKFIAALASIRRPPERMSAGN